MTTATAARLASLFERDETAWLEAMSKLIRQGRLDEVDSSNLAEYLSDMARRDRREVTSRLSLLIAHHLKWIHQPDRRSGSWRATVEVQRQELSDLLESGVLRGHATEVLPRAYANGVRQAAAEMGLPASTFPENCPFSLDEMLSGPLDDDPA
ncbi:DUF29 domain-containing protein [Tautonia plasticadhaerens]|uniref:DUF29 domain-containing protein n=1 Tax=Tautonia plasticadhaerens TaxID=2527974 RepID=A0A518H0I7_9BACT|nr:DUF29 domain-containing protein [Tautonia plasticadhaerens]QDV34343.1 hypothetical protein ElP_22280 [Tautonia plasticadhaerens]